MNHADVVERDSALMDSSTVKATALKAMERGDCSGRPPLDALSRSRIALSFSLSLELKSYETDLPVRVGVMTSRNDGGLDGLGAPSAWREREARGTPRVRTSHRCVGCAFMWTPVGGLNGESGPEHELVTEHSDFGLRILARGSKKRKGSIDPKKRKDSLGVSEPSEAPAMYM